MERGKLIVIEGSSDGCGKATQAKLLEEYLISKNIPVRLLSFPTYTSQSSGPVQMYLHHELGELDQVTAIQASILYAVDRFCTIRKEGIEQELASGMNIICDRYVESNLIYHTPRLTYTSSYADKEEFINTITTFEYETLAIPKPDHIFFLKVEPANSKKIRESRASKIDGSMVLDMLEENEDYLLKVYDNSIWLANKMQWDIVSCNDGEEMYSPEDISIAISSRMNIKSSIEFVI